MACPDRQAKPPACHRKAESTFQLFLNTSSKKNSLWVRSVALTSPMLGISDPKDLNEFGENAPENH